MAFFSDHARLKMGRITLTSGGCTGIAWNLPCYSPDGGATGAVTRRFVPANGHILQAKLTAVNGFLP